MKIQQLMQTLRLQGMHQMFSSWQETSEPSGLTLNEGLTLLLNAELQNRDHRKKERLTKQAGFRYTAYPEEIIYNANRGLDKDQVISLTDGQYIQEGRTILISGQTGSGKSFMASALGHQACVQGFKTTYFNMQKLSAQLKLCRIDGSSVKFFDRLAKKDLLIIDDFGLTVLDQQQRLDLMEIIEDRHRRRATIIVSQLPFAGWYDAIGDQTIADAIMDRLVHQSLMITLKGESLRKKL
jgi:DNA replication protein DnaC